MALKVFKFWGGFKFGLDPELQVDTTLTTKVVYVNPLSQVLRLPKIYWRTNLIDRQLVPIGIEFALTMPQGSTFLEFYEEYTTETLIEYTPSQFRGKVTVTLTAAEHDPVLPGFGTREYTFQVTRQNLRGYNYITMLTHLRVDPGSSFYHHYYRFAFKEPLRRAMQVTLLDLAGNPLADNQNQNLLKTYDFGDPKVAGWPLFSSSINHWVAVLPPQLGGGNAYNASAVCLGVSGNELPWTIKKKDQIIIPPGTFELRLGRKVTKTTVYNALLAAQSANPNITELRDAFILDFQDAGSPGGEQMGRDNRFVPQSLVVTTMNADPPPA